MHAAIVLLILLLAIFLFVTEKFRIDMVAMIILGALLITQSVTPQEAISGFSNEAVITVACVFVMSSALSRTGVVKSIGLLMIKFGRYPIALILLLMLTAGVTSMFINNTAVVAVFLPLAIAAANRTKISASKLLMPMSFASQAGGVCTLIGTSTNLLVSSISDRLGFGPFSMFELTPIGIFLLFVTMLYFVVIGKRLLPDKRKTQLLDNYSLGDYVAELRIEEGSQLVGSTIIDSKITTNYDIVVLKVLRREAALLTHTRSPLQKGDVLLVEGSFDDVNFVKDTFGLIFDPEFKFKNELIKADDLVLVEVMIAPRSRLVGKTLARIDFFNRFRMTALAIRKNDHTIHEKLNSVRLSFGDVLLLQGPKEALIEIEQNENFIVLDEIGQSSISRTKGLITFCIFFMVVFLATLNVLPILVTAILGCIALILFKCTTVERAYESIDWQVIFLLAGTLPLGIAMMKSGAAETIATLGVQAVFWLGPIYVLGIVYLITAVLTELMSNNATAVLLAPIAVGVAHEMGLSPKPFLMAVTFAASTCFTTPVGYQTNAMVFTAGGYRYLDFVKVGLPLNIIFLFLTVYLIPLIWPLNP